MIEAGILLVIILITLTGILAGRKVQRSSDFLTGGGRASTALTTGALVGTLLGSQCTLGTAQLAFNFGVSAWWFTLGSGLGCLFLGLFYALPLRKSGCTTQFQIISKNYGALTEKAGAILCTTGTFVSILAQVIACVGFIPVLYPSITPFTASILTVILMCMYIVMGGTWGAGMGGIVKTTLLYVSCIACLILVVAKSGGIVETFSSAENFLLNSDIGRLTKIFSHEDFTSRYLNLTARGTLKDLGSCVSLILGILSTQSYMQYILSSRGDKEAKSAMIWGALLVPPIGIAGVFIGLFMRANYLTQAEVNSLISLGLEVPDLPVIASTIQVFPAFIINHVSPILAGVMLGTLLITTVSGSSGLLLGVSAIAVEDIFPVKTHKLFFSRLTIIITLIIAVTIANIIPVQAINDLGFLSMTLRASVVFMPLTCALWFGKKISPRFILASIILSPTIAIIGALMKLPVEPLFTGFSVSILLCVMGFWFKR
ncbi:MAG: sodium:solute symporter family protein [Synergistaceae bacterium]|nr:sodium:solute symporter family protein [Synergistaceae bacterium]